MAFKMKGFDPGKGTGMSPKTMKKGSSMKMKKESSMKKPLVGDQHKLPQELKAAIKAAPMKLGMRDPNMAMKASNNMLPGSMMAMKANRSAMTLKKGGSVSGAKSMKDKVAAGQGKPKFKTKSKTSVGTKESAKRISARATGKTVDPNTKRRPGAKFDIKKAAAEKAKQKKFDKMPSPMKLEEGMIAGAAMAGGAQAASEKLAGRKRTGDLRKIGKRQPLSGDPKKFAQRMRDMKKSANEGAAEAASQVPRLAVAKKEARKNVSPNKMGHSPKKMKKESAMNMKARAAKGVKKGSGMTMKKGSAMKKDEKLMNQFAKLGRKEAAKSGNYKPQTVQPVKEARPQSLKPKKFVPPPPGVKRPIRPMKKFK